MILFATITLPFENTSKYKGTDARDANRLWRLRAVASNRPWQRAHSREPFVAATPGDFGELINDLNPALNHNETQSIKERSVVVLIYITPTANKDIKDKTGVVIRFAQGRPTIGISNEVKGKNC